MVKRIIYPPVWLAFGLIAVFVLNEYYPGPRFTSLADEYGVLLIPFILEGVALNPDLMQDDGIHPTAVAQPLIVDAVLPHLLPLVK